jgi:hypothetical protein
MARRATKKAAPAPTSRPDSRWVTVTKAYDHYWGHRAITHYPPGQYRLKNAVADAAIKKGYASEGRLEEQDAKTADSGSVAPVGDENAADADRAANRPTVDPDAE